MKHSIKILVIILILNAPIEFWIFNPLEFYSEFWPQDLYNPNQVKMQNPQTKAKITKVYK